MRWFLIPKHHSKIKTVSEVEYNAEGHKARAGYHGPFSRVQALKMVANGTLKPDFVNDPKLKEKETKERKKRKPKRETPTEEERKSILQKAREIKARKQLPRVEKPIADKTEARKIYKSNYNDGYRDGMRDASEKVLELASDLETLYKTFHLRDKEA